MPPSPSHKITGHKYDRYGVDGEHFKIDCTYSRGGAADCLRYDDRQCLPLVFFFVCWKFTCLLEWESMAYALLYMLCMDADYVHDIYCAPAMYCVHWVEVQKKNVEVKSNAFRSLTSSLHYVKEYTIDMDSSSATAQQKGTQAKQKVTYKLTQLKRIHSSYQIRWVWGCRCYERSAHTPHFNEAKQKKEGKNEMHKKCAAYGLRCRRRKNCWLSMYFWNTVVDAGCVAADGDGLCNTDIALKMGFFSRFGIWYCNN